MQSKRGPVWRWVRRVLIGAVVGVFGLIALGAGVFFSGVLAGPTQSAINDVEPDEPLPAISPEIRAAYRTMFVADLHADTLLWRRVVLDRTDRGHVDLPRMAEGNMALQIFTMVSRTPMFSGGPCLDGERFDILNVLNMGQRRPISAWFDPVGRIRFQIDLFQTWQQDSAARAEEDPGAPRFRQIRSAEDLDTFLDAWQAGEQVIAGVLGIEGANALAGDAALLDEYVGEGGVRMFGPGYLFDNLAAGSSTGCTAGGLTEFGTAVVQDALSRDVLIDLAHASPAAIVDIVDLVEAHAQAVGRQIPVVVSHTGIQATVDRQRNLRDQEVHAVASTGGLVGIGFWSGAIGRTSVQRVAETLAAARDLLAEPAFAEAMRARHGHYDPVDHLALGSDFDGAVTTPVDTSGLIYIAQALADVGFSEPEIRRIMGQNVCRVLYQTVGGADAAVARGRCDTLQRAPPTG